MHSPIESNMYGNNFVYLNKRMINVMDANITGNILQGIAMLHFVFNMFEVIRHQKIYFK